MSPADPSALAGADRGLLASLRRWRESRQVARHAIPERLWRSTLARYPFLACRPAQDLRELRRLASLFLATKEFTCVGRLRLTDRMAVAVAAQACLPVLRFGLQPYAGFLGIVLHPDAVVARREWSDEAGVVHQGDETLAGEAMERGPVMLSWRDVAGAGRSADWGYNVVVHEFAHVFDLHHRLTSAPSTGGSSAWRQAMQAEYDAFAAAVDAGQETLLDAYGACDLGEFFAVGAEVFFVRPEPLAAAQPRLYQLLRQCFRQDPASSAAGLPEAPA